MALNRYSQLIGLPVICADSGKKAGSVKDVIFCPKQREVRAFLMESKGWSGKKRLVWLQDILSLGRDAVVVSNMGNVTGLSKVEYGNALKDEGALLGLRIYSKTGEDLGVVRDVVFDPGTGRIEGVEVSDGLLQDLLQGRRMMPLFGRVEFGEENLLVDREAVEEMVNTGGGIKNRLKS